MKQTLGIEASILLGKAKFNRPKINLRKSVFFTLNSDEYHKYN